MSTFHKGLGYYGLFGSACQFNHMVCIYHVFGVCKKGKYCQNVHFSFDSGKEKGKEEKGLGFFLGSGEKRRLTYWASSKTYNSPPASSLPCPYELFDLSDF